MNKIDLKKFDFENINFDKNGQKTTLLLFDVLRIAVWLIL